MPPVFVGVANMQCRRPGAPLYWDVSFCVSGHDVTGRLVVPVPHGVLCGENILKVARNRLLFAGSLADATAAYALTDEQVLKLRKDFQPDPLLR
ncbi:hypothetical protein [Methylobacterium nodulans]|uniref:Uncharacterized protein n=1 Tax=Methylobacterium nodulans (strain LMG 21967 / CNCM I-2342 / ORS 2060) TaxID=460265 RepID=B8IMH0_METNO|nr:hypothetical protein [Methylobacterium nodulans]ACL58356.1 hypothetical protein Mnod_3443 [Methylobacterium nodulans ORS 2060]